jgi:hypothetical protein
MCVLGDNTAVIYNSLCLRDSARSDGTLPRRQTCPFDEVRNRPAFHSKQTRLAFDTGRSPCAPPICVFKAIAVSDSREAAWTLEPQETSGLWPRSILRRHQDLTR